MPSPFLFRCLNINYEETDNIKQSGKNFIPPGRKNERGARGSVEEEISAAKRSNMANNEAGTEQGRQCRQASDQVEREEPSLHEIKSMLVDIQITVSSIALQNKQLKKELADFKTYIQT